jgi:hypothetical protein
MTPHGRGTIHPWGKAAAGTAAIAEHQPNLRNSERISRPQCKKFTLETSERRALAQRP